MFINAKGERIKIPEKFYLIEMNAIRIFCENEEVYNQQVKKNNGHINNSGRKVGDM